MIELNLQYFGGRGSAGARGGGGSKTQFYEGAPKNVIKADAEARDWLAKEFGAKSLEALPNKIDKEKTYSRDTTIAESRSKRIIIYREEDVTTEVMVHEYTHNLTNSIFTSRDFRERNKEFNAARKEVYKTAGIKANKANDSKYVSKYGSTNSQEFFSEITAQYYNGKRNAVINAGMSYLKGNLRR